MKRFSHYILNLSELDTEHEQLANTIQSLKISNLLANDILEKIKLLIDSIADHFKNEEKLMLEVNFPYYEYHKYVHENLIRNLNKSVKQHEIVNTNILKIIAEEFFHHIDTYDRDIAKFINENKP